MLVADFLFLVIVVYLAYRFIFNFLIPIVRATHQVRRQFRDMGGKATSDDHRGQRDFEGPAGFGGSGTRSDSGARPGSRGGSGSGGDSGSGSGTAGTNDGNRSYKPPAEDYIDFEEIK